MAIVASWDADSWNAAGQVILAIGAVAAAAWAIFTYRKARRAEAAQWLHGLFRDFYKDEGMVAAREVLEYDFDEVVAGILELRVTDRQVPLADHERETLRQIDLVLNYFEQLLYLEHEGHLAPHDREVFFQYWFDLIKDPERAALRRYLAKCGYERCAAWTGAGQTEYVAFYGSLMNGYPTQDELGVRDELEYVGSCVLEGQLYSRGQFPCMAPGADHVEGELFTVRSVGVFRKLDPIEHYDPENRAKSIYRRRCVHLIEPSGYDAWTYVWNGPVDDLVPIPSGSWKQFEVARQDG
jgi:gamma-glutamylcyclotransferase (GGCT)/AIG2-like uncharacterized protein YtfP